MSLQSETLKVVGRSRARRDGWEKVTGRTLFVGDISVPGMWYGGVVRSEVARGHLREIALDDNFDWRRVAVVTAGDLPGPNMVAAVRNDCPILAFDRISYRTEPVALIAAPTKEILAEALGAVRIKIDQDDGPPVLSMEEALKGERVVWGNDNVLKDFSIDDGDIERGFGEADVVVEGTYRTPYQEQVYLETQGAMAIPGKDGRGVEIVLSCQCPYYVHNAVTQGLRLDSERVLIRQAPTGGGFGGKEFYPSLMALQVALLALKSGHPVRMIYDRREDLLCTSKRHPSITRIRTGHKKDGRLVAMDFDITLNGGAYTTLSVVVLQRAILHATGSYHAPNVRIRGRAVATNLPPSGGFRGFGCPQSLFALERHMDRAAAVLNMDSVDLRYRNLLRPGDAFPFKQRLKSGLSAELVLDRALKLSGYREKKAEYSRYRNGRIRRGIGLSLYLHGCGFTGSGEDRIATKVKLRFVPKGKRSEVELLISNSEIGQGASTVLTQIVAETLAISLERVIHNSPDTSRVPDSGPTVASRTTMIVGRVLMDAARNMLDKMILFLSETEGISKERMYYIDGNFMVDGEILDSFWKCALRYVDEVGELLGMAEYDAPGASWDDAACEGNAYHSYSWACDVAEVEVDMDTLEIRPIMMTVVVEIGRAINPLLVEGQLEGGTLQALGYGYLENIEIRNGLFSCSSLSKYLIPTAMDVPDFNVSILETPYENGPYGAKGVGELPMNGGAPALAAAVGDATGTFPDEIPVTPERLVSLLKEASRG